MKKPPGLGDAIKHARAFVGKEPFVVALGDTIIRSTGPSHLVKRLSETHLRNNAVATIAVWEVEPEESRRYGVVKPQAGANPAEPFPITDIVEKPSPSDAPSRYAVAARYVFGWDLFDALETTLPGHGGEVQLTDAVRQMVRQGKPVWCVPLTPDETRYDIGNPETYFKAFIDFAFADEDCGAKLRSYARKLLHQYDEPSAGA